MFKLVVICSCLFVSAVAVRGVDDGVVCGGEVPWPQAHRRRKQSLGVKPYQHDRLCHTVLSQPFCRHHAGEWVSVLMCWGGGGSGGGGGCVRVCAYFGEK